MGCHWAYLKGNAVDGENAEAAAIVKIRNDSCMEQMCPMKFLNLTTESSVFFYHGKNQ